MVEKIKNIGGRLLSRLPSNDNLILIAVLIVGGIVLLPNGIEARLQRAVNFQLIMFAGLGVYFWANINKVLGAFILFLFAHMFFKGVDLEVLHILFLAGVLYAYIVKSGVSTNAVYNTICIMAAVNLAWQVMQYFGIYIINHPISGDGTADYVGLLSNRNETSAFMAFSLCAFMRKKWIYLSPIALAGVMLAFSWNGVGVATVIFTAYAVRSWGWKKMAVGAAVAAVLIAAFNANIKPIKTKVSDDRYPAWKAALTIWTYNPAGWGIGQFKAVFPLLASPNALSAQDKASLFGNVVDRQKLLKTIRSIEADHPGYFKTDKARIFLEAHNEYIETLFNIGPIGLGFLIFAIGFLLKIGYANHSPSFYGLFASALSALFFFTWHIIPLIVLTVFYAAIIERREQQNEVN